MKPRRASSTRHPKVRMMIEVRRGATRRKMISPDQRRGMPHHEVGDRITRQQRDKRDG